MWVYGKMSSRVYFLPPAARFLEVRAFYTDQKYIDFRFFDGNVAHKYCNGFNIYATWQLPKNCFLAQEEVSLIILLK